MDSSQQLSGTNSTPVFSKVEIDIMIVMGESGWGAPRSISEYGCDDPRTDILLLLQPVWERGSDSQHGQVCIPSCGCHHGCHDAGVHPADGQGGAQKAPPDGSWRNDDLQHRVHYMLPFCYQGQWSVARKTLLNLSDRMGVDLSQERGWGGCLKGCVYCCFVS